MSIILRENAYRGVNAHLHSVLQNESGGWKVFYTAYITVLAQDIDAQLPPGYEVGLTKSLQIAEYHPTTGERITRRPEPDVTIYDTELLRYRTSLKTDSAAFAPTLTLPAIETMELDEDLYLTALVIYEVIEDGERKPVTRIELLSPTNKPPGEGFLQYREKRNATLEEGTPLVEIDYLHESAPPIRKIPSYRDRQPGAHPYWIAVTDPRPSLEIGETQVFGFDVDEPIPTVEIPLAGSDKLMFDFDAPYQRTFASLSYFRNRSDYEQEPPNFDSYTLTDQQRIHARMTFVQH
jgi:hypothetical protein